MQTVQMVAYKKKQDEQDKKDKSFDLLGVQQFPLNSVHFKPMEEFLWYEALRRGHVVNGAPYAFRVLPLTLGERAEAGGEAFNFIGGFQGQLYCQGEPEPKLTCRWTTSEVFGQVINMIFSQAILQKKLGSRETPGCYFVVKPGEAEAGNGEELLWVEKRMPERSLDREALTAQGTPDLLFKEAARADEGAEAVETAAPDDAVPEVAAGGEQEHEPEDEVEEVPLDPGLLVFPRVVLKDPQELERSREAVRNGDRENEAAFLLAGEAYLDPESKFPWVEVDRIIPVSDAPATSYEVRIPGESMARISYDYASSREEAPTYPLVGWAHSHLYEWQGAEAARQRAAEAEQADGKGPTVHSGLSLSSTDCMTQQIDWPRAHQVALLLSLNRDCEVESAWYGWCCGQVVELKGIYTNGSGG